MTEPHQWYFAYGSNMLSDVFIKRRKVNPIQQKVAYIKTHTLCFNIMGMPYRDPAMGGIREAKAGDLPVYGVAYLLTPEDMRQVVVSEGYLLPIQAGWKIPVLITLQRRHCIQNRDTFVDSGKRVDVHSSYYSGGET